MDRRTAGRAECDLSRSGLHYGAAELRGQAVRQSHGDRAGIGDFDYLTCVARRYGIGRANLAVELCRIAVKVVRRGIDGNAAGEWCRARASADHDRIGSQKRARCAGSGS